MKQNAKETSEKCARLLETRKSLEKRVEALECFEALELASARNSEARVVRCSSTVHQLKSGQLSLLMASFR